MSANPPPSEGEARLATRRLHAPNRVALSRTKPADGIAIGLAWSSVLIRVVHSLIQATVNKIPLRFALNSLVLLAMLIRTAWML